MNNKQLAGLREIFEEHVYKASLETESPIMVNKQKIKEIIYREFMLGVSYEEYDLHVEFQLHIDQLLQDTKGIK